MKLHIYKDATKEYRWRLIASNGRIVADSGEGFKKPAGIKKNLESMKKGVDKALEQIDATIEKAKHD